jgi:predicted glycoside hydrolase/deacetylase ChbG (UPF0249 family)
MGYSHAGNLALIKCFKEGIQTSIEVIVPSPWFPEAVQMLAANPTADVGIHLALTSEWDNIKWHPLTTAATLRDSDGYFYPMVYPNKNYPGRSISDNNWSLEDVEKEFRAQIEMALKKIPRISHLSFHMGCHNLSPQVRELTKKLALEYHLSAPTESDGVVQASFDGATTTAAEKIESFIRMLQKLQPGKTYLFVEHPGIDGEELRAVHHIGYEEVAADRQGVTDLYTSEKVKAIIKQKGIQLVSYKQIAH